MKKILVTGAAGFIGSHICENLLKNGCFVTGIDIVQTNLQSSCKQFNLSFLTKYKHFSFYSISILDRKQLDAEIQEKKYSYIIHCAGKTGVRESLHDPSTYYETNVLGTMYLLDAVRRCNSQAKFIIFSSSSVCGLQKTIPFSETVIPNPQSPYGYSKYCMELVVRQYCEQYGLPAVVVRPFSVYGPRGRMNMAPFLMMRAAEKGEAFTQYGNNENNQRDWTYIDDCVSAVLAIIERRDFKRFEIFNIGNGKPTGIEDWVNIMQNYIEYFFQKRVRIIKKPRNAEEMPITYADIAKAKKMLKYSQKTNIKDGLEKVFQHYMQCRDMYKKIWESR